MPARAQDEALTVTHGFATFGLEDLTYPADFEHLAYVNPDAPQGGEMSLSWSSAGGSFDSMHPYTNQGNPAVLASIFFESMLEGTLDTIGESYCLLCETMAYPEDRSYVIFTIREEARFSDGTPVTADDALFSYEILRDEGLPSFRANIPLTIDSAEVLDERRIRFNFNPESQVRGRIEAAGGLPVFSRASHEASGRDFSESRLEPLVGSGPYVLAEVDPGRSTVYQRDADYWGNDLPINRGRHNFASIRVEYYADEIAAFDRIHGGQLNMFLAGAKLRRQKNWANSYDFPAAELSWHRSSARIIPLKRGDRERAEFSFFNVCGARYFSREPPACARGVSRLLLSTLPNGRTRTLFWAFTSCRIDMFLGRTSYLGADGIRPSDEPTSLC